MRLPLAAMSHCRKLLKNRRSVGADVHPTYGNRCTASLWILKVVKSERPWTLLPMGRSSPSPAARELVSESGISRLRVTAKLPTLPPVMRNPSPPPVGELNSTVPVNGILKSTDQHSLNTLFSTPIV